MAKLRVGQVYRDRERRFKITDLKKYTVRYVEIIGKQVFPCNTSRIQWEFDVDRGKLTEVK